MILQIRAYASLGFKGPLYGFLLYSVIVWIRGFGCTFCFQQIFEKEYQATFHLGKKKLFGVVLGSFSVASGVYQLVRRCRYTLIIFSLSVWGCVFWFPGGLRTRCRPSWLCTGRLSEFSMSIDVFGVGLSGASLGLLMGISELLSIFKFIYFIILPSLDWCIRYREMIL